MAESETLEKLLLVLEVFLHCALRSALFITLHFCCVTICKRTGFIRTNCNKCQFILGQGACFIGHDVLHLTKVFHHIQGIDLHRFNTKHRFICICHFAIPHHVNGVKDGVELKHYCNVEGDDIVEQQIPAKDGGKSGFGGCLVNIIGQIEVVFKQLFTLESISD